MTILPRAATSDELTKLRAINQSSRLYLTIHAPATVYTARLAAVPSSTDSVVSITYNTGSGTHTNIVAHQTLLVGTSAGASDLGMCRIRSTTGIGATSGTFNIGETSEINWSASAYLTVLDEFLLWRRDPRVSGSTIYMDYDIAYSDQHALCNSIPVLGPPAVKWLTASTVTVSFDASQSWALNNTITGYSWTFTGASATSGTTTATPTATYNAVGTYRAQCTITNSDGATATGYRYVFIIAAGSAAPSLITHFNLDSLSGDYTSGGWSAQVTLVNQADMTTVRDRALAILHTRDWYGPKLSDEGSVGYVADRENIQLVGWVALEADTLAPQDKYSSTTFTIQGPQYWLGKMTAFPAGLKDKDVAVSKWTRFRGLTGKAATWHILEWRTTAPRMMDCFPMDNGYRAARLDAPGAQTVWAQLNTIIDNALIAKPCCDSYGRLFMQVEQNLLSTATRSSIPTVMTLTRSDWMNDISFDRRQVDDVGYVDMSGVIWNGATPTPLFSLSPGHVFRRWGSADVRERLVLYDQATTNTLCGAYYGWKNNPYPRFTFDLAMNNHLIDLAPYQYLAISIASTDTPRGFTATGLRLIPRSIRRVWNAQYGFFSTQLEAESESSIGLAITGDVPASPPKIPTDPPPPPPPPPPPVPVIPGNAHEFWFAANSKIFWAGDYFNGGQPTWNMIDPGLGTIDHFAIAQDGSAAYVHISSGTSVWYQGTNLKTSPSWVAISPNYPASDDKAGDGEVYGTTLYTIINQPPYGDRNWKFGTYNGSSWSFNAQFTKNQFTHNSIGKTFAGWLDDFRGVTGTVLASVSDTRGNAWESAAGARLAWVISGSTIHFYKVGTGNIINCGSGDVSALGACRVRGVQSTEQLYAVDHNGILHLSEDGSSFSSVATWSPGLVYDTTQAGGGDLVWILNSITASNVPTRLYARDGLSSTDMTGNLWSLIATNLTVVGAGVVY